jgi:DHA2 family multidrug resistance protein
MQNVHEPEDVRVAMRARAEIAKKNLDIAGIALMAIGVASLQYLFEEGSQKDWFDSIEIRIALFVAVLSLVAFVIRELTATAPVVNLRLFKDATFTSATLVAFLMFGMLMGSMFLLPVFAQESLHYTATLSGIVLMPRTLAMMAVSPIVGRIYNAVQPRIVVGVGVILFAVGSYQLSTITLETSATQLIIPLVITGAAFACLFVPLTTAALSKVERHQMADAAGLNSFVRQIGGSIGLSIFATMFTNYATEAAHGIAPHITSLRPEVAHHLAQVAHAFIARGMDAASANMLAGRILGIRIFQQATVLSFDRVFILQGVLFLFVIPVLYFLKVDKLGGPREKVHIDIE